MNSAGDLDPEEWDDEQWRSEKEAAVRVALPDRIRERLAATHQTARGASLKAGLGPDAIRTILTGRSVSPRAENLAALAQALDCDVSYLLGVRDEPRRNPRQSMADSQSRLVLRYYLKLHSFTSGPEYHSAKMASNIVPVRTKNAAWQHLELLQDASFGRMFPQGTLLHAASIRTHRGETVEIAEGQIVILERAPSRAEGKERLVERTARLVSRDERGWLRLETAPIDPALTHVARLQGDGVTLMENGLFLDREVDEVFNVVGRVWRAIIPVAGPPILRPFTEAEVRNQAREDGIRNEAVARIIAIEPE